MSLNLEYLGITNPKAVYRNLPVSTLTEKAIIRGEGTLSNTGALVVKTGKYTSRSANDKFIVDTPAVHDEIAWGKVNRPIERRSTTPFIARWLLICKTARSSCSTALRVRTPSTPSPSVL